MSREKLLKWGIVLICFVAVVLVAWSVVQAYRGPHIPPPRGWD